MSLVLRSQLMATTGRLIEGTSTVRMGNLSYLWGQPEDVDKARMNSLRQIGGERKNGVCFRPLNSDVIVDVDETYRGIGMGRSLPLRADAVVTRSAGVGILLLLADCQAVSFFDPVNEVIAVAHCGRVSTDLQLARQVVAHMVKYYGSRPEEMLAFLGPSIAAPHYLFGAGITSVMSGWGSYLHRVGDDCYSVDIRGYNLEQLRLAGLHSKRIESADIDTYSSDDYFSHVRSSQDGVLEGRFGTYLEIRATKE